MFWASRGCRLCPMTALRRAVWGGFKGNEWASSVGWRTEINKNKEVLSLCSTSDSSFGRVAPTRKSLGSGLSLGLAWEASRRDWGEEWGILFSRKTLIEAESQLLSWVGSGMESYICRARLAMPAGRLQADWSSPTTCLQQEHARPDLQMFISVIQKFGFLCDIFTF